MWRRGRNRNTSPHKPSTRARPADSPSTRSITQIDLSSADDSPCAASVMSNKMDRNIGGVISNPNSSKTGDDTDRWSVDKILKEIADQPPKGGWLTRWRYL
jgi:hypothetical protein